MNRPKIAGTRFERAVADWFCNHGFPYCERQVLRGAKDRGDLLGIPGWALELKATKTISLADALTEAKTAAANSGADRYAAIIKRRSHQTKDAYVVMTLEQFAELIT